MVPPDLGRLRFAARLLSMRVWRRRLSFWTGALAVGLAAIAFAKLSDLAQTVGGHLLTAAWWVPFVVTPSGFLVCARLTHLVAPAAGGSGIPQAAAASEMRSPRGRERLLGTRVWVTKIVLTVFGLVCGASVGREGPTVQIGAGIMLATARLAGIQRERALILAGSAAGIAGAFNTPLAGVVFAIEEMSRAFEQRTHVLVLYAVISAGLASLALVGDYNYFGHTSASVTRPTDWIMVGLVGVLGGFAGGVFSRLMLVGTRRIAAWTRSAPLPRRLVVAAVCGLVVATIGAAFHGATFGTGYEQARAAIEGRAIAPGFWAGKLAATLTTALSGIPGGIFAPSLAVGAGFGDWLGSIVGGREHGLAAILGMSAYFAGVVQSPMTAFVIIMEMTDDHAGIIPLMTSALLGWATSRYVSPEPLYRGLSKAFAEPRTIARRATTGEG